MAIVGSGIAVLVEVGSAAVGATVDDCRIEIVADGIGTGIEVAVHAAAKTTKKTSVMTCR